MKMVLCLENERKFYFDAKTGYEALTKMKYTLDLKHKDENAIINRTHSGLHLWMEHSGKTYAVLV